MKILNLRFYKDESVYYPSVDELVYDRLVLGEYFFIPWTRTFFSQEDLYSDRELEFIASITDKEYYFTLRKYLNFKGVADLRPLIEDLNQRLVKLEAEFKPLIQIKSVYNRMLTIDEEIRKINIELDDLELKIPEEIQIHRKLEEYKDLMNINFDKIHQDIVNINSEISLLEEEIVRLKSKEIVSKREEFRYTSDASALFFGFLLGSALVSGILLWLNLGLLIPFLVVGWGLLIVLFIVLFTKKNISRGTKNLVTTKYSKIQDRLIGLKRRRRYLLSLVGFENYDDFLVAKASINSYMKILDEFRKRNGGMTCLERKQFLKQKLEDLIREKNALAVSDAQKGLPGINWEEFSSKEKLLESIKSDIGMLSEIDKLSFNDVLLRLKQIRNELKSIFVDYKTGQSMRWNSSLDSMNSFIHSLVSKLGLPSFSVEKNFSNFFTLQKYQIFISYLAFISDLLGKNYSLIAEFTEDLKNGNYFSRLVEVIGSEYKSLDLILVNTLA